MEAEVRRELDEIRAILRVVAERQAASEKRMDRAEARAREADARMDRAAARMDKADARMDRAEARMDRADSRAREAAREADARARASDARFEKRMKDFERIGMKEIVELRRLHRESEHKLNALIDSQQRTEAALRAFMDSLRRGGNGHGGRTR